MVPPRITHQDAPAARVLRERPAFSFSVRVFGWSCAGWHQGRSLPPAALRCNSPAVHCDHVPLQHQVGVSGRPHTRYQRHQQRWCVSVLDTRSLFSHPFTALYRPANAFAVKSCLYGTAKRLSLRSTGTLTHLQSAQATWLQRTRNIPPNVLKFPCKALKAPFRSPAAGAPE